jgi:lysophospholipase L1-like esterase
MSINISSSLTNAQLRKQPTRSQSISLRDRFRMEGTFINGGGNFYGDFSNAAIYPKIATASFTASMAGNVLTVSAVASGTLAVGNFVRVANVTISSLGTGTGGVGTYNLAGAAQNIASTAMTAVAGLVNVNSNNFVTPPVIYSSRGDPGRALWMPSITLSSNKNLTLNITYGGALGPAAGPVPAFIRGTNQTSTIGYVRLSPGVPVTVPVDAVLRGLSGEYFQIGLVSIDDADMTGVEVTVSSPAMQMADDFNFLAPKTFLWMGDSIGSGAGINRATEAYWWNMFRTMRDTLGIDMRHIQASVGGTDMAWHELLRQYGNYDIGPINFLGIALGVNDALYSFQNGGNVSYPNQPATYTANLTTMYNFARTRWGNNLVIIVFGATPLSNPANNTPEGILATIRTAGQTFVSGKNTAGDANILYCNLAGTGTFDKTVSANYTTDGIHPTPQAHATLTANIVTPFLSANAAILKAA